jgi:hypothetical protein
VVRRGVDLVEGGGEPLVGSVKHLVELVEGAVRAAGDDLDLGVRATFEDFRVARRDVGILVTVDHEHGAIALLGK